MPSSAGDDAQVYYGALSNAYWMTGTYGAEECMESGPKMQKCQVPRCPTRHSAIYLVSSNVDVAATPSMLDPSAPTSI
jgi:hypothetical protein